MKELLIVTSESDTHADAVIEELENSSTIRAIRLNSDTFIKTGKYCYAWDSFARQTQSYLFLQDSLKRIDDLRVIWWRKPYDYVVFPEVVDEWAVKYCQQETESLMYSLSGLYPQARWVNPYHNMRLPSHRINHIPIAQKLGMNVPPTIVTNSYEAAFEFIKKQGKCIIKPMRFSGFLHRDKQYACYTRFIDENTLSDFCDSIALAPTFIQKYIHKKAEYRVTLIGKQHFICRIDAKHLQDSDVSLDWRVTEPDKLIHVTDSLPGLYINKLYQMLEEFSLSFGAFDIIQDEDNTLYFIELNPNGQWYWIEILTGMPMAKAMVELIEDLAQSPC